MSASYRQWFSLDHCLLSWYKTLTRSINLSLTSAAENPISPAEISYFTLLILTELQACIDRKWTFKEVWSISTITDMLKSEVVNRDIAGSPENAPTDLWPNFFFGGEGNKRHMFIAWFWYKWSKKYTWAFLNAYCPWSFRKTKNRVHLTSLTIDLQTVSQNCSHAHSKHCYLLGFDLFICPYNYRYTKITKIMSPVYFVVDN